MKSASRIVLIISIAAVALSSVACASLFRSSTRHGQSTSLVDFVVPEGGEVLEPSVPNLRLPLSVGVAFVPGPHGPMRGGAEGFTEQEKMDLARHVVDRFDELRFVDRIEIIPSAYLRQGGGFTNLDQIRRLYGIDVIALLSYDQVQFTRDDALSITYWTLVGAYVVPGEKNDTHTLIDAAVFDIPSRKLLFRAPGTSMVKGRAAPINLEAKLARDSARGFDAAGEDMIANLDVALADFQVRVKERPEEIRVSSRPGHSGDAGAFLGIFILMVFAIRKWSLCARRS